MKVLPVKFNYQIKETNCPCPKPKFAFSKDEVSFSSKKPRVLKEDIYPLYSEKTIQKAIKKTADEINKFYKNEPVTTVCLLKGADMFNTDLAKHLDMPLTMEYERLSSYAGTESTGEIHRAGLFDLKKAKGKNILIIEDVIDTGKTLTDYKNKIEEHNPKSVNIVVLCDKISDRREKDTVKPDFSCIKLIGDDYIVGYGMDYNQQFRNLPYIGGINKDKLQKIADYEANSN